MDVGLACHNEVALLFTEAATEHVQEEVLWEAVVEDLA